MPRRFLFLLKSKALDLFPLLLYYSQLLLYYSKKLNLELKLERKENI